MADLVIRNVAMLDKLGSFDGPFDITVHDGSIEKVGRDLTVSPGATALEADAVAGPVPARVLWGTEQR